MVVGGNKLLSPGITDAFEGRLSSLDGLMWALTELSSADVFVGEWCLLGNGLIERKNTGLH